MHQTPHHEIYYFFLVSWAPGECGTYIDCWLADYAGMTPLCQGFFRCIRPVERIGFLISRTLIHQRQPIYYSKHHFLHVLAIDPQRLLEKTSNSRYLLISIYLLPGPLFPPLSFPFHCSWVCPQSLDDRSKSISIRNSYAHVSFQNHLFRLRPQRRSPVPIWLPAISAGVPSYLQPS